MSYKYRLTYSKTGPSRYIGHLDLQRVFKRGIRRAALRPRYTEGFNPHSVISFAQPLGVGMTGLRELADIELMEDIEPTEITRRLEGVFPDGLEVTDCVRLESGAKTAASLVRAAAYDILIKTEDGRAADFAEAASSLAGGLIHEIGAEGNLIRAVIACGGRGNLKPSVLAEELCEAAGVCLDIYGTEYIRRELIF